MVIHQSPPFADKSDLFAYLRPLPWRSLRIYVQRGQWHAVAISLPTNLTAKA